MTLRHFRLFLGLIMVLALLVTGLYTRYSYIGSHARYDLWKDEHQTMIEGGDWIPMELEGREA